MTVKWNISSSLRPTILVKNQDHSLYLMTLLVYFGHTIFRRWAMYCFTYYTKKVEQGTRLENQDNLVHLGLSSI